MRWPTPKARSAPQPPRAEIRPARGHRPRRDVARRLCLDSRRELARGAARSRRAARGNPRAARGGKRLCRGNSRPDPRACSVSWCAKCARACGKTTANRRRPTGPGPITRAFATAASTASTAGARARGGKETVLIDGDARAEGDAFFQLGPARAIRPTIANSPGAPTTRARKCTRSRVRDLAAETDLPDRVENATGEIVWTRNSSAFLYVLQDENHRPFRVMLHRLGRRRGDDVCVFEEADPAWFLALAPTRLGRRAFILVHGHDASEAHVVDLETPAAAAAPDRAAPAGTALSADGSRRCLLHQDQQRRRARFRDRRRAGRGARGGELAPVPARQGRPADRDRRRCSRTIWCCWRARRTCRG